MSDIETQIRSKIETAVTEITALVRADAVRRFSEAMGGTDSVLAPPSAGVAAAPVSAAKKVAKKGVTSKPKKAVSKPKKGGKGVKRTAEDLTQIANSIATYVKAHPGEGIEKIAQGISIDSQELKLPIKKLLSDGVIKTTGQRRGTKYSLAK